MPRVEASQAHQCAVFVKYDVRFGSIVADRDSLWIFKHSGLLSWVADRVFPNRVGEFQAE